jgi:alkyl sulfatase BDS1-like metallo-beta-lactamase superfamily hydrolase
VFAEPDNQAARALCADAFEQLGYQAESATWRNAYLTGARELRRGVAQLAPRSMLSPELLTAVNTSTLFDFIAVRLDPARVEGRSFVINWVLEDTGERVAQTLEHSTLTQRMDRVEPAAAASVTTTRATLVDLILRRKYVAQAVSDGVLGVKGDVALLEALFAMLDDFALMFEVVAPRKA